MWDVSVALPEWLLVGLVLGGALSIVVSLIFVLGQRLFARLDRDSAPEGEESGVERRRAEIRQYLQAIDERYAEARTVDGQRVDFYLPDRDVAVTFDARAFFALQDAGTDVVLIEHEMPGAQLGSRLPFETPEIAVDDGTDQGIAAAFAALGLPAGATLEEVQRAYRERVKEVHPDQGGDKEEFQRVREAYDTAREYAD